MKSRLILSSGIASIVMLLNSCATSGTTASSKVKPYTKDTCLVTDNELGSMGDPVRDEYQGQEIKFCCKPCLKKFYKNPGKYLTKL